MLRRALWGASALSLSAIFALACARGAEGTSEEQGLEESGGMGGIGGRGTTSSSSSASTGGTGGMGMGGMGAGGMSSGSGGSTGCNFTHVNTCQLPTSLGNVAGDKNEPAVVVNGTTSEWFVIEIQEKDSNILEEDLSYTVTLLSPNATDYDLYVHQGPEGGSPDCSASPMTVTVQGNTETVHNSWDDDQPFPTGEDDSRYLNIEVRHVSGNDCNTPYTLTIEGHT